MRIKAILLTLQLVMIAKASFSAEAACSSADELYQELQNATYQLASTNVKMRSKGLDILIKLSLMDTAVRENARLILLALLNDRTPDYRIGAAITLINIKDEAAYNFAVPVLIEDLWNGPEPRKALIIQNLKQAGTEEALEAITEYEKPWWKIW